MGIIHGPMRIYPVWYFLADVNSKVSADPVLPNLASIISGTDHTLIPALADATASGPRGTKWPRAELVFEFDTFDTISACMRKLNTSYVKVDKSDGNYVRRNATRV